MEPQKSTWRAALFLVAVLFLSVWNLGPLLVLGLGAVFLFLLVGVEFAVTLSLQAFLAYRAASYLRMFTSKTDRLDAYFYGSRHGGIALILLASLWTMLLLSMAATSVLGLSFFIMEGLSGGSADKSHVGVVWQLLCLAFVVISPGVLVGVFIWTIRTLVQAIRSARAPGQHRPVRLEEEIPLDARVSDDWENEEVPRRKD